MTFRTVEMDSVSCYRLLTGLIVPRPIAFVSTVSARGIRNLAPFSFFMVGGSNPPSLVFCPTSSTSGEKDTLTNIRETGEYVVNLVDRSIADQMNLTSKPIPADDSEWDLTTLTPIASEMVAPPRVKESFAQLECRLYQVVSHGAGAGAANYVIGEVLRAHIADRLVSEGSLLVEEIHPIARLGSDLYLDLADGQNFRLSRP